MGEYETFEGNPRNNNDDAPECDATPLVESCSKLNVKAYRLQVSTQGNHVNNEAQAPRPAGQFFFLTMFWQHSQYDSRLGFSFRVRVRLTLTHNPKTNSNPKPNPNITLPKTLKLNPNLLSYWDCCQRKQFAARGAPGARPGRERHSRPTNTGHIRNENFALINFFFFQYLHWTNFLWKTKHVYILFLT